MYYKHVIIDVSGRLKRNYHNELLVPLLPNLPLELYYLFQPADVSI